MFYTKVNREIGATGCNSTNTGRPLSVNSWLRCIYTTETYKYSHLFQMSDRPVLVDCTNSLRFTVCIDFMNNKEHLVVSGIAKCQAHDRGKRPGSLHYIKHSKYMTRLLIMAVDLLICLMSIY